MKKYLLQAKTIVKENLEIMMKFFLVVLSWPNSRKKGSSAILVRSVFVAVFYIGRVPTNYQLGDLHCWLNWNFSNFYCVHGSNAKTG